MNKLIFLSVFCCTLFSCRTTPILKTNFPEETIGTQPRQNIPGDPAGDSIIFSPEIASNLLITSTGTDDVKVLRYTATGTEDRLLNWLSFKGANSDLQETIYYIINGQLRGSRLTIDLNDGLSRDLRGYFSRLTLNGESGEIKLVRTIDELGPGGNVIGELNRENGKFVLIYAINTRDLNYDLSVFSGRERVNVDNVPTLTRDRLSFANPAAPRVSFTLSNGELLIESVQITRKRPEMM